MLDYLKNGTQHQKPPILGKLECLSKRFLLMIKVTYKRGACLLYLVKAMSIDWQPQEKFSDPPVLAIGDDEDTSLSIFLCDGPIEHRSGQMFTFNSPCTRGTHLRAFLHACRVRCLDFRWLHECHYWNFKLSGSTLALDQRAGEFQPRAGKSTSKI